MNDLVNRRFLTKSYNTLTFKVQTKKEEPAGKKLRKTQQFGSKSKIMMSLKISSKKYFCREEGSEQKM